MTNDLAVKPVVLPKKRKKRTKEEVRDRLVLLKQTVEASYLEMGRLLHRVQSDELWNEWSYSDFEHYTMDELGFRKGKASYLIRIWQKLKLEAGVSTNDLKGIGWSKAKELTSVATAENVGEWLVKARKLSVPELNEVVRAAKDKANGTGTGEVSKKFSFVLFEDQSVNVENALDTAGQIANSQKKGHLLDLICTEWLANHVKKDTERLPSIIQQIERVFGIKLLMVPDEKVAAKLAQMLEDIK
jgi:hypothetical protein